MQTNTKTVLTLLAGLILGIGIGFYIFSKTEAQEMMMTDDMTSTTTVAAGNNGTTAQAPVTAPKSNSYMMATIRSEKQFLQEMIKHHEAAVTMSQQLLKIQGVKPDVISLAKRIIETQSTEIKTMRDWLK